jgi:hypothetical protein
MRSHVFKCFACKYDINFLPSYKFITITEPHARTAYVMKASNHSFGANAATAKNNVKRPSQLFQQHLTYEGILNTTQSALR